MEDLTIRRRNRLRHHYTITSNVLLFGYKHLPDGAKLTYQVIDSFDWGDGAGVRKGFAYPSLARLADIRGVDERTIRRHLVQLEQARLISRQERPGKPSLLIIEDPSPVETQRYFETFGGGEREDNSVRPTPDGNVRPLLQEDKEQESRNSLTRFENHSGVGEHGRAPISDAVRERVASLGRGRRTASPDRAKREHLAQEMLRVLHDEHSLGCYRRVAEQYPPHIIFEALGLVKEMARECKVAKTRGALFVQILKRRTGGRDGV